MFDKDAEKIAYKKLCSERICYYHCNFSSPKHHRCGEWHRCYESAKEGMELGYDKANEWHYVKDGDLPKETGLLMSKTLLLVTKMKGSDYLSLVLGQYNFSTQEFSYQHMVGLTDVIAWKEIVLPESLKS